MAFPRLAAVLGLAVLTEADEGAAVAAVEARTARVTAERDAYQQRAQLAETERATLTTSLQAVTAERDAALGAQTAASVDALIERAYAEGRLVATRDAAGKRVASKLEPSIRTLAKGLGVAGLTTYVEELPVIVPLNQRIADDTPTLAAREELPSGTIPDKVINSVAAQLGLNVDELKRNAAALDAGDGKGRRNRVNVNYNIGEG